MNKSNYFDSSKSTLALCCVLNAAQGFSRFWRFWAPHSMPCTQDAPSCFTESDDNQPNRKRSREAAHRLHDAVKRGTVWSIHADNKYFMSQASADSFLPDFKLFCPKSLRARRGLRLHENSISYLKYLVEFCILSVITYKFAISTLRFTCKCAIL